MGEKGGYRSEGMRKEVEARVGWVRTEISEMVEAGGE